MCHMAKSTEIIAALIMLCNSKGKCKLPLKTFLHKCSSVTNCYGSATATYAAILFLAFTGWRDCPETVPWHILL